MRDGDHQPSCRGVWLVAVGKGAPARLVQSVASVAASGVRVLLASPHPELLLPRPRTFQQVGACLEHLTPEVLRGYVGSSHRTPGRLEIENEAFDARVWKRLTRAFDFMVFGVQGCGKVLLDAICMLGIGKSCPAILLIDVDDTVGVTLADQTIALLREHAEIPKPVAFSLVPFDATLAARLSRRWALAAWREEPGSNDFVPRLVEQGHVLVDDLQEGVTPALPVMPCRHEQVATQVLGRLQDECSRAALHEKDRDPSGTLKREDVAKVARRITSELTSTHDGPGALESVVERVVEQAVGFGPLDTLIRDPKITEIMLLGDGRIYVERGGCLELHVERLEGHEHHMAIIERLLMPTGRRIDESQPAVDARLADGSRLHAIIPPLAIDGPTLTIRRFSCDVLTLHDLVRLGSIDAEVAEFLREVVRARQSIVVSGGTGSGKTTLLAALAAEIDPCERIVTIEDAAELSLRLPHVVRLQARPANIEGVGAVTIRELTRNALRMRPDRIVIGECRGPEALDMLSAMNTGHEGSLTTVHANSPRDALLRLETMALMADVELPHQVIREQVSRAIAVIVQVARTRSGARQVVEVAEITGMEGDVICLHALTKAPEGHGNVCLNGHVARFQEQIRRVES